MARRSQPKSNKYSRRSLRIKSSQIQRGIEYMYNYGPYRNKPRLWKRKKDNDTYSVMVYKGLIIDAQYLVHTAMTEPASVGYTTIPHIQQLQPLIDEQLGRLRPAKYKYNSKASKEIPPGCNLNQEQENKIILDLNGKHVLSISGDQIGAIKNTPDKLITHIVIQINTMWKPGVIQSNPASIWGAGGNIKDGGENILEFMREYINEAGIDEDRCITIEVIIDSYDGVDFVVRMKAKLCGQFDHKCRLALVGCKAGYNPYDIRVRKGHEHITECDDAFCITLYGLDITIEFGDYNDKHVHHLNLK